MPAVKATVTAYDVVTAYGGGAPAYWDGLMSGRTAIADLTRFDTTAFMSRRAALAPGLDPDADQSFVMQMLSPMLAQAADAIPADSTVILATTVGEVDLLESNVLNGSGTPRDSRLAGLLEKIRAMLHTTGPAMVISSACASSTSAIAHAAGLIRAGAAESVLVVACDSVTEFVFSGFSTLMALDTVGARPFDRTRKGLTPGDAAGFVHLMADPRVCADDRADLGEIAGWGMSNDANHMTGPSRDGGGLASAIERALTSAGVDSDAIGSICAHGTGTAYNDAMEMKAFRRILGERAVPVYSVKGAIGHTMGAAGLVETVLALESLQHATVPPTVNTTAVDDDAAGWVSTAAQPTENGKTAISTNSGFGGVNAALVLQKGNVQRSATT